MSGCNIGDHTNDWGPRLGSDILLRRATSSFHTKLGGNFLVNLVLGFGPDSETEVFRKFMLVVLRFDTPVENAVVSI